LPGAVPFIRFGASAATIGGSQFDNSGGAIIPPASYVATLSPQLRALLHPTTGAYTAAFFNAGGKALTTKIEGNQVLADPGDFANAQNFLYFADLVNTRSSSLTLKNQFIIDYINTEKLSSYGYAFNMKQFIIEDKITVEQKFTVFFRTSSPVDRFATAGPSSCRTSAPSPSPAVTSARSRSPPIPLS
jgi:hypothetical protein